MTRISKEEARELHTDTNSVSRRDDFDLLKRTSDKTLSAAEYLDFLSWAAKLTNELPEDRGKIGGKWFLL